MTFIDKELLKVVFRLLPKGTKNRLAILISLHILITILDILAIALMGLLVSTGLMYVRGQSAAFPEEFISIIGLSSLSFETQFMVMGIAGLLLFALRTLFSIYSNFRILRYLGEKSSFASDQMITKLFATDSNFLLSKSSQELVYGMTVGVDNLILLYLGSLSILATDAIFLTFVILCLLVFQPITGLSALLIFGLATILIHNLTAEKSKMLSEQFGDLSVIYNQRLIESLLIYRELVLRGKTEQATTEVQDLRKSALNIRARIMFLPTMGKYLFELALILGGIIFASIQLVVSDTNAAITALVVFVVTTSRVLPALVRAQSASLAVKQSEGYSKLTVEQLREIDELNTAIEIEPSQPDLQEFEATLSIQNVSFKYPNTTVDALIGVDFSINQGEFVAIVGESGAGKTTLADILLGMYLPSSGKVMISNHSPKQAIKKWPGKIAYVPQDVSIIEGDIRKNVALSASFEIEDEQVISALERAYLLEDVLRMPNQLSENVGERGTRLSGGQRQRLGIARALFTNPEIIIFDEATSSLDPIAEKAVTDAIYGTKGKITLIVIAHRLSTVQKADVVILLEKGKIVAKGTFDEVRAIAPKFDQQAKLVNL